MARFAVRNITETTYGAGNGFEVDVIDLGLTVFRAEDYDVSDFAYSELEFSDDLNAEIAADHLRFYDTIAMVLLDKDDSLNFASQGGHFHDNRYYQKDELDAGELNNLYYTEAEVTGFLAGKSPIGHSHYLDDILDVNLTGAVDDHVLTLEAGVWKPKAASQSLSIAGKIIQLAFVSDSSDCNLWMSHVMDDGSSNSAHGIIPFNSKLVGLTFSNKCSGVDVDILVKRATKSGGSSDSTVYTWDLNNVRWASKTNFSTINFAAGDKIGLYMQDRGTNPSYPIVIAYLLVTDDETLDLSESYSGYF